MFPVAKEVRLDVLDESRHYSSSVCTSVRITVIGELTEVLLRMGE